tara:strand:+ start:82 stop:1173 length:1092 start_codon:yes stop_codon:yes gene_type:complete
LSSIINEHNLVKSIFYLRFFILLYFLNYFLSKNIINLEKIFKFYFLFVLIVALDLIFQHFLGFNVIGLKILENGATSFFGDERIAGSFIKQFGFFAAFFLFEKLDVNKNIKFITRVIFFSIINIAILVSWQRVPMLTWFIFFTMYGLFYFKTKFLSILTSFIVLMIFINIFTPDVAQRKYGSFYDNATDLIMKSMKVYEVRKDEEKLEEIKWDKEKRVSMNKGSGHHNLFMNSIFVWEDNKIFGVSLKNFLKKCNEKVLFKCSQHPHNFYLDILVTTGLLGLIIILAFLIIIVLNLIKVSKTLYKTKNSVNSKYSILLAFNFLMYFFPFQSTGGFFTTANSTYMILITSLLITFIFTKSNKKI